MGNFGQTMVILAVPLPVVLGIKWTPDSDCALKIILPCKITACKITLGSIISRGLNFAIFPTKHLCFPYKLQSGSKSFPIFYLHGNC